MIKVTRDKAIELLTIARAGWPVGPDKELYYKALDYSLAALKREKALEIIQDWDRWVGEEGGEEKFQKKYGADTTELTNLIEKALKGG